MIFELMSPFGMISKINSKLPAWAAERLAAEQEPAPVEEVGELIGVIFTGKPVLDPARVMQARVAPRQVRGRGRAAATSRASGGCIGVGCGR